MNFTSFSFDSKYNEMTDFYGLLNSFINTYKATTDKQIVIKIEF